MPRIIFIEENGIEKKALAEIGETILEVAHANDVNIEGACGGNMACATCHLVVRKKWYDICLLYTSPSPRDAHESRMPSSA